MPNPTNPQMPPSPPAQTQPSSLVQYDIVPTLPPFESSIIEPDPGKAYWAYGIHASQHTDKGLRANPLAMPYPGKVSIQRCHGGITRKAVSFVAVRFNCPPVAPSRDTGTANDVILDDYFVTPAPEVLLDGSKLYWIVGIYLYVCQQTPPDSDPIIYPNSPILQPSGDGPVMIDPADFNPDIYGDVPDPSNFDGGPIDF